MAPRTQYAHNGDVSIAYQVVGDGPLDLIVVPGFISHLDLDWADDQLKRFLDRLGSFTRLIRFDKRGTGLSDPAPGVPTLEERMEDVHAVLDAAGSTRAALFGYSEGGPMAALFAATYPERTTALIMYGSFAKIDPAHPGWKRFADVCRNHWGEGALVDMMAPSVAHQELRRSLTATYERASASPGMARALLEAVVATDVTPVLPSITVPSLVLHRRDEFLPIEGARELAHAIPGARMVELDGIDHLPFLGDSDALVDEVAQFLTGARHEAEPERALATVLFTDIVSSTERAAELGDARWRELLEQHDRVVCAHVDQRRGRTIKTTGDGVLATFDGPARAIRCAAAAASDVAGLGVEIRAGIHTGECELLGDDIAGMAVHIGARVAALAGPGEVLVSSTVKDLVAGSGISFSDRGTHTLKGVPDEWRLYSAQESGSAPAAPIEDTRAQLRRDRASAAMAHRAPWVGRSITRALRPASRRRG